MTQSPTSADMAERRPVTAQHGQRPAGSRAKASSGEATANSITESATTEPPAVSSDGPRYMFVAMTSAPGSRAKVRPELRASAKAHVMRDYQRKTAHTRTAEWRMSTKETYPLTAKRSLHEHHQHQHQHRDLVSRRRLFHQPRTGSGSSQPTSSRSTDSGWSTTVGAHIWTDPPSRQASSLGDDSDSARAQPHRPPPPVLYPQPGRGASSVALDALPIAATAWDACLITRWLHYDRVPWCPINGQSKWIPFVLHNAMLLHTNMYCWGMHFHGKLTGGARDTFLRHNPDILKHKIAAMRLMNEHIASQPADAVATDEILAAVSIFLNVELAVQSRDEAVRHFHGLASLLDLRGGLACLAESGAVGVLLQRLISWNDMFFVELFGGSLSFAHLPRWEEARTRTMAALADDPVTHLEPLQARFAGNAAREVQILLAEIRLVCRDVQVRPRRGVDEKTVWSDGLFAIERRLCLATRITTVPLEAGAGPPVDDGVWRAVSLAALMYVHHHVRGHPAHLPQFVALLAQLRAELARIAVERWAATPDLHVWVLSVAAVIAPDDAHLVGALAAACRRQGCNEWEAFQRLLATYPHVGARDEERHRRLWTHIAPAPNTTRSEERASF